MVVAALQPAIKAAIRANELGAASPYRLAFASLGKSGGSFGVCQGDTNVDCHAREVLLHALTQVQAPPDARDRIIAALARACPDNPLPAADNDLVNAALASPVGRALVDAMDDGLFRIIFSELDGAIAAAASRKLTIEPAALLYIALWVNMTGAPTGLNRWLRGAAELGAAAPAGPLVSREDLETYLHGSKYFRMHPANFVHMSDSVDAGLAVLAAQ
jgi:hypothetical protein